MRTIEDDMLEYLAIPFNMFKSRRGIIDRILEHISENPKWIEWRSLESRNIDLSDLKDFYAGKISSNFADDELYEIMMEDIKEIVDRNIMNSTSQNS